MRVKTITCSGANENTSIDGLLSLLSEFPMAEAGIQISAEKCSVGTPRYSWIIKLASAAQKLSKPVQLALHINKEWVEDFCSGIIAPELSEFMALSYSDGSKIFRRLQLNFKIGREKEPDIDMLAAMVNGLPEHRFVFSYNPNNAAIIRELYRRGVMFDNLFDSSFGEGVIPICREGIVFEDRLQGYAGGLGPENIKNELDKINDVNLLSSVVYVDAEGHLKGADGSMSLEKARDFISKILQWEDANV